MSIFGKISHAIFGDTPPWQRDILGRAPRRDAAPVPVPAPASAPHAAAPAPHAAAPAQPTPVSAQPQAASQPVDVEQVLAGIAAKKGNPSLDWHHSIVDLMKLLDLDSSLDQRKELADELGYTGAKDGSAAMNLWLHRRVMEELEKNGGTVPASLKG